MANEIRTPYYLRRPFRIPSLDIALGGGAHAGGPTEIHGSESVGKTYLAWRLAGQIQRIYGDNFGMAVMSTEIRIDKSFARRAGCCIAYSEDEIAEFEVMRAAQGLPPFTEEEKADLQMQVGIIGEVTGTTADEALDEVLRVIEMGPQLVLLESLGALLTPQVEEGDVGDAHYAGSSRLLTNFQNKVYPLFMMDRADGTMLETTIIGINQARALIGGSPKGPKTRAAAGAYAWKHGLLASVELGRGADIKDPDDVRGPPIGREIRWKLGKGKAGTHDGKKGRYNWFHIPRDQPVFWSEAQKNPQGFGVDEYTDLAELSKDMDVVTMAGAWVNWNGSKWNGGARFAEALHDDPELYQRIYDECLRKSGVMVRYK